MHGPVLRTSPVTISNFLCVPHYYWGAGRPEWVSGSIPTVVPCPPSGLLFRLHVGYRITLLQSLNQCRTALWLYDTFLHNRIYQFVLSLLFEHTEFLIGITGIQHISVLLVTYIHSRGPYSSVLQLCTTSDIYIKVNYDKLHQSGLCRLELILLTPIMIISQNTIYMSPEYCLYSLERPTA